MSVRSDVGVCRACGAVELARDMVRLGAYLYACRGCSEAPAKAGAKKGIAKGSRAR